MAVKAYELKDIRFGYPGSRFELEIGGLAIDAGTIAALVGPNAAGKTTLLMLLGLLHKPSAGAIQLFGQNPWNEGNRLFLRRRELAMVSHNPYLFKGTVFDNLVFGLKVRGISEKEWKAKAEEALGLVDMSGFEQKPASGLSAGQAQRIALARALILKPRVLLLDEPTANIDASLVSRIEALINEVNSRMGTTIVFSTHNFSQAFRIANEVIYLSEGKRVEYSHENYFSGHAQSDGRVSWIEPKSGTKIFFPGQFSGHLTCVISPGKIKIFSDEQKKELAGPNLFAGKITRLEMAENDLALVRVAGDLNFRINLPLQELKKKKVALSMQILVKFPPEAVEVIK